MLKPYLRIRNWLRSEEGQDLAEYALLLGVIAIVVAVAIPPLARAIGLVFARVTEMVHRLVAEPAIEYPRPWWWPWWWPWPWW